MKPSSPLKIVFMGTPDFAVPALEVIHQSQHQIQAVVTVPDKPQGRGRVLAPSAVKKTAIKFSLPLLQPQSLKDEGFIAEIGKLNPDLIVVVAFQILPEAVYSIPKHGAFNLHASLLPKYRGAAPIHWALLKGDTESGVTTFFLKSKVDTGNIIAQSRLPIKSDDNLETLYGKLRNLGADLVLKTIDLIAAGEIHEIEQDDTLATPAPKVTTNTQRLNFEENCVVCHNRVRAFAPTPGAFTFRDGVRLKILKTEISEQSGKPGQVIQVSRNSFSIACGEGSLIICTIQPESKKAMDVSAYMLGNPIQLGDHFG